MSAFSPSLSSLMQATAAGTRVGLAIICHRSTLADDRGTMEPARNGKAGASSTLRAGPISEASPLCAVFALLGALSLVACGGGGSGGGGGGGSNSPGTSPSAPPEDSAGALPPTPPPPPSLPASSTGGAVAVAPSNAAGAAHEDFGYWLAGRETFDLATDRDTALATAGFDLAAPTPLSDMPTTGTASYRGGVVAGEFVAGELTATLDGNLVASADFARGRVDAAAELANAMTGSAWGRVSFDTLAISGDGFAGNAVSSKGHSGPVAGTFFGPTASEVGGLFELNGLSVVKGAFAAKHRQMR